MYVCAHACIHVMWYRASKRQRKRCAPKRSSRAMHEHSTCDIDTCVYMFGCA